jgi:Kef-type K+ transport system membrane component KefB
MEEIVEVLWLCLLLLALWAVGSFTEAYLGCPALIAEIVVGAALGPHVLNVVPEVEGVRLVGLLGLLLIVLEGGLHIELKTLKKIGKKAFFIAITGTITPVLVSLAVLPRFASFSNLEGTIAGVSLSSTAIGMAAKMMQSMGLLSTHLGQLITCAAMIDDVASLVLLAIISNTVSGSGSTNSVIWAICLPLISSIAFICCSIVLSHYVPRMISRLHIHIHGDVPLSIEDQINDGVIEIENIAKKKDDIATELEGEEEGGAEGVDGTGKTSVSEIDSNWDIILLTLLLLTACVYTAIAHFARTTFLLGTFFAGVSYSSVPSMVNSWDKHMPVMAAWTGRIFFASIGFAIPVEKLFSARALYFGVLLTFIAVISKVSTGTIVVLYVYEITLIRICRVLKIVFSDVFRSF